MKPLSTSHHPSPDPVPTSGHPAIPGLSSEEAEALKRIQKGKEPKNQGASMLLGFPV